MSVQIIDTLKPKNNGSFPVAEAVDIAVTNTQRLPEALAEKASAADVASKADAATVDSSLNNLQEQIDQIEISASAEAVVAPEVAAARVDEGGTSYETLKQRIDADQVRSEEGISTLANTKMSASAFDYGYALDYNMKGLWEQGAFDSEGNPGSSTATMYSKRIRTKGFINTIDEVRVSDGYQFFVYKYDSSGNFISSSGSQTEPYNDLDFTTYKYKLMLGKYPNADTTVDDYDNAFMLDKQINSEVQNARTDANNVTYDTLKQRLDTEQTSTQESIELLSIKKVSADAMPYGYTSNLNAKALWEQGHMDSEGNNGSSTAPYYTMRIRTKTYIPAIEKIIADSNHVFIVYKYELSGTYVESSGVQTEEYSDFDFTTYKYRIAIGKKPNPSTTTVDDDYNALLLLVGKIESESSAFDKHDKIDFGAVPDIYYRGLGADYSNFNSDTNYATVISAYDALVTSYPEYLTSSELGLSSDGRTIYGYNFKPRRTNFYNGLKKKLPKILLISAQHGFEKSSVYGIYYFLRDLLGKYEESTTLAYIHDNLELMIIPVCNPYGFDNNLYVNANGVNINRNYLCSAWHESEPGTTEYGGPYPFSEPESQIVRDLVLNNLESLAFIDYHTNGSGSVSEHKKINWHSYRTSDDVYYKKWEYASARHITRITSMFAKDYNINFGTEFAGFIDQGNSTATSTKWAYDNGIPGMTFEGFNGFVGESAFTEREKKANSELIGNFLAETLRCYSNELY